MLTLSSSRRAVQSYANSLLERVGLKIIRPEFHHSGVSPGVYAEYLPRNARVTCCMDVGANVGQMSLAYAKMFPDAAVYALEPAPSAFAILKRNTQRVPRIRPANLALSDEPGAGTLHLFEHSFLNSLKPDAGLDSVGTVPVQIDTLDRFCKAAGIDRIDILKTDTEGFDLRVLRGAAGLLSRRRIAFIYAECGLAPDDTRHTNFQEMMRFLDKHGFRCVGFYDCWYAGDKFDFANALFVNEQAAAGVGSATTGTATGERASERAGATAGERAV